MKHILTFIAGLTFGLGIIISGMSNPAKVINFFDVAGTWDGSLLLVMAAALVVTFFGYRVVLKRPAPAFAVRFYIPTARHIDRRLVGGSALFGIGWGISGFCPGGVLPVVSTLNGDVLVFAIAMMTGILGAKHIQDRAARKPAEQVFAAQ